jgi:hypothetical protein
VESTTPTLTNDELIARNLRSAASWAGQAGAAVQEGDLDRAEVCAKVSLAWSAVAQATVAAQP